MHHILGMNVALDTNIITFQVGGGEAHNDLTVFMLVVTLNNINAKDLLLLSIFSYLFKSASEITFPM